MVVVVVGPLIRPSVLLLLLFLIVAIVLLFLVHRDAVGNILHLLFLQHSELFLPDLQFQLFLEQLIPFPVVRLILPVLLLLLLALLLILHLLLQHVVLILQIYQVLLLFVNLILKILVLVVRRGIVEALFLHVKDFPHGVVVVVAAVVLKSSSVAALTIVICVVQGRWNGHVLDAAPVVVAVAVVLEHALGLMIG